jgi:hypothetical protein
MDRPHGAGGNKPGKANRRSMKKRINLVLLLALALTLIGVTLTLANRPGRDEIFLLPGRRAHVTSTRRR